MSNRLPTLLDEIRDAHNAVTHHLQTAAERVRAAGAALVEAKTLCPHVSWAAWLAQAGLPEASFLTFTPQGAEDWRFRKLGLWQPAERTARRGGGQLQAVERLATRIGTTAVEVVPWIRHWLRPTVGDLCGTNPNRPALHKASG